MSELRFSTVISLFSVCAMLFALLASSPVQEVAAQYYYYSYTGYVPYYYPYSSQYSSQYGKYIATVSISGLPSEYSATVKINGNDAGTVQGGSSKQFEVRSAESNVFQVENYISGPTGVRYFCREASWNLEAQTSSTTSYNYYYPYYYYYYPMVYHRFSRGTPYTTYYYYPSYYYYPYYYPTSSATQVDVAHSFSYVPEYMLTVENQFGQSTEKAGWKPKDSIVTLSASERIDRSSVERNIFKSWSVDSSEITSSTITVTMNAPHKAAATYQTQYFLEVRSELDSPQGSGWYNKGSEATISVAPEVPMVGFWGSLGAKNVFGGWSGVVEISQAGPTARVVVDKPTTVAATWRQDYSTAYALLAAIIVALAVIVFAAVMVGRRYVIQYGGGKEPSALETLSLRYSRGEITREDYLKMKKDIEKS